VWFGTYIGAFEAVAPLARLLDLVEDDRLAVGDGQSPAAVAGFLGGENACRSRVEDGPDFARVPRQYPSFRHHHEMVALWKLKFVGSILWRHPVRVVVVSIAADFALLLNNGWQGDWRARDCGTSLPQE
jgi:hypothetical protein